MAHGQLPDHNRIDLDWITCDDCAKADGFMCGKCYQKYRDECEGLE